MDRSKLINRLGFIVLCVITLQQEGCTQSITSFSVQPNPVENMGDLTFFNCIVENFNAEEMVLAWRFNGRTFVDIVFNEEANFRPNVDDIFGFEVNPLYLSASMFLVDEDDQIYQGQLDVFVSTWRVGGDYTCAICRKNVNGRCEEPPLVLSDVETLNVNYFPPDPYPLIETTALQNGRFLAVTGSETMVSCYSLPGFPEVEFVLSKGGVEVDGQKTEAGEFVFYNYTFIATASDDGAIFSCTIQENSSGSSGFKSLPAIQIVSIPQVEITGPSMSGINATLVLTCEYTSATSTPAANYMWNATGLKSSYSANADTLTIQVLQENDNGVVVTCTVTDTNGMTGVGSYTINAVNPSEIPTTNSPASSSTASPTSSPVAIIVVACLIAVLLLLLLSGTVLWWWRQRQEPKKSSQEFGKKSPTAPPVNKNDHHSDKNGPYTISNKVSDSPKPDIIAGYYNDSKYRGHDDYPMEKSMPVDATDYRYPSYERSRSQDRFYPQDDDIPGYHYNPGYDDERQLYPQEFNDVEVGDFTQPSDREPAYGQGYDDYDRERDYNDPRGPGGYDGYDDDFKPPLEYDGYGGSVEGYDDRYRPDEVVYRPDDGRYGLDGGGYPDDGRYRPDDGYPDDGGYRPNDDGYRPDDGGYEPDDGIPFRPHRDNNINDEYYPPREDQFPLQDNYSDPNLPAEDDYFRQENDMYPKNDQYDQYDYEPYGERDQVPDGQEADFQGDPYNDPYYPSSADRMPDGGQPSDDPYYGYDINPDAGEFSNSPKHNSDTLTSDGFDPSYV